MRIKQSMSSLLGSSPTKIFQRSSQFGRDRNIRSKKSMVENNKALITSDDVYRGIYRAHIYTVAWGMCHNLAHPYSWLNGFASCGGWVLFLGYKAGSGFPQPNPIPNARVLVHFIVLLPNFRAFPINIVLHEHLTTNFKFLEAISLNMIYSSSKFWAFEVARMRCLLF